MSITPPLLDHLGNPQARRLGPIAHRKPLDFGARGITGSLRSDGRLLALNAYHPQHGYQTLTSAPPFPDADRHNPAAVRAFRRSLAEEPTPTDPLSNRGFGLQFAAPITEHAAYLLEDAIPYLRLRLADGRQVEVITFVPESADAPDLVQLWQVTPSGPLRWSGSLALQRCAYTQLTEGGVLPLPPLENTLQATPEPCT
ncbi:MAG: hypothetical protein HC915_10000 [Anaerolineae bacterium]|nr:hypothetical protein [Anaerolineae bacterium]